MSSCSLDRVIADGLNQLIPEGTRRPKAVLKKIDEGGFQPLADRIVEVARQSNMFDTRQITDTVVTAIKKAPISVPWSAKRKLLDAVSARSYDDIHRTLSSGLRTAVQVSGGLCKTDLEDAEDPSRCEEALDKAEGIIRVAHTFNEAQRVGHGAVQLSIRFEISPDGKVSDPVSAFKYIRDDHTTVKVSLIWEDDRGEFGRVPHIPCIEAEGERDLNLWWDTNKIFAKLLNVDALSADIQTSRQHHLPHAQRRAMIEQLASAANDKEPGARAAILEGLAEQGHVLWINNRLRQEMRTVQDIDSALRRWFVHVGDTDRSASNWQELIALWRDQAMPASVRRIP